MLVVSEGKEGVGRVKPRSKVCQRSAHKPGLASASSRNPAYGARTSTDTLSVSITTMMSSCLMYSPFSAGTGESRRVSVRSPGTADPVLATRTGEAQALACARTLLPVDDRAVGDAVAHAGDVHHGNLACRRGRVTVSGGAPLAPLARHAPALKHRAGTRCTTALRYAPKKDVTAGCLKAVRRACGQDGRERCESADNLRLDPQARGTHRRRRQRAAEEAHGRQLGRHAGHGSHIKEQGR